MGKMKKKEKVAPTKMGGECIHNIRITTQDILYNKYYKIIAIPLKFFHNGQCFESET